MAINLYKGVDAQADLARKRASQTEQSQVQTQRDAMSRRAAQMGGGPGGAMVKQERILGDESAQRLQQANEGIEAARMGEHGRIGQVLQGQEFARGERLGTQKWQSGEAATQRGWQTSERLGAQTWQSGEAETQRQWGTSERLGGQEFTAGQNATQIKAQYEMQQRQIAAAAKEGKLTRAQADKQLAELKRQFNAEQGMAERTNTINTILSANNSGLKPEVMGQLFAALGINIGDIPGLTEARQQYSAPTSSGGGGQRLGENGQPLTWKAGAAPGYGWNSQTGRWEKYA